MIISANKLPVHVPAEQTEVRGNMPQRKYNTFEMKYLQCNAGGNGGGWIALRNGCIYAMRKRNEITTCSAPILRLFECDIFIMNYYQMVKYLLVVVSSMVLHSFLHPLEIVGAARNVR